MAQKYTQVPADTFEKLQLNAGILVDGFTPSTGTIGNLLGATSGGIQFASNPTYTDYGEDVDNVPSNTKELKKLESYDPQMSGTFLTCTAAVVASLVGAADVDEQDDTHVIPRGELEDSDFDDIWWIGDYSNINEDKAKGSGQTSDGSAGFLAIHLKNALNTSGFQIQSTKNEKGKMSFEYHGHYTLEDTSDIPFEFYVQAGTEAA